MTAVKPMLAAKVTPEQLERLPYPLLASPKLDGVRCLINGGVALSRNLKPIRNRYVQSFIGRPTLNGLDGELIVGAATGEGVFNRSQSGVMSTDGEPQFTFYVFDDYTNPKAFSKRYEDLHWRSLSAAHRKLRGQGGARPQMSTLEHEWVTSSAQLLDVEAAYLERGFEGIMLRRPSGPYKQGRSTLKEGYLMKLKRFRDGEAVVVDIEEAEENTNAATLDALGHTKRSSAKAGKVGKGTVGTIVGRDVKTGALLRCGAGTMPHDERLELWTVYQLGGREKCKAVVGRTFTYRVFDYGAKDTPRFPLFHGFRHDV